MPASERKIEETSFTWYWACMKPFNEWGVYQLCQHISMEVTLEVGNNSWLQPSQLIVACGSYYDRGLLCSYVDSTSFAAYEMAPLNSLRNLLLAPPRPNLSAPYTGEY